MLRNSSVTTQTRPKRVWMITWEFATEEYFLLLRRKRIAAILDCRVSDSFIKRYLPLLYSTERNLRLGELYFEMHLNSVRRFKSSEWKEPRWDSQHLVFGDHPWLAARIVDGFSIESHEDKDICYWIEPGLKGNIDDLDRYRRLTTTRTNHSWDEQLVTGSEVSRAK